MDDEDQLKVDVAVIKEQVKELQDDTKDLKTSLDNLSDVLKDVKSLLDQYKGFIVAVILIGSLMGWIVGSAASIKAFVKGLFN